MDYFIVKTISCQHYLEQKEAEQQYKEVIKQYTNTDGTKKAGWLKAPNGKPTKLTERQWVLVRTPLFKEKFGDWESLAKQEEISQKTAIAIKEPKGELKNYLSKFYEEPENWRRDIINWVQKIVPSTIESPNGEVNFSRSSAKNIIAHGKGPLKILTIPYLYQILKDSVLFYTENTIDKQGRKILTTTMPILLRLITENILYQLQLKKITMDKNFMTMNLFIK